MTPARDDETTRTVIQFSGGVHLPAWLATVVGLALLFSALGFLLALFLLQNATREIRVLELHTQDVENVLIRQGIATREDFPEWGSPGGPRTKPINREKEK